MSILNNDGIVFHDRAGGGWYCNTCKRYIHPDMRFNHKHTPVIDLGKSSPNHPLKPLKSAQRPNTDSRELRAELRKLNVFSAASAHAERVYDKETKVRFQESWLDELERYTANKQRQLLEWVDKNVVGADETGKPIALAPHVTRNYLRAAQREQLKNKKESLGEG